MNRFLRTSALAILTGFAGVSPSYAQAGADIHRFALSDRQTKGTCGAIKTTNDVRRARRGSISYTTEPKRRLHLETLANYCQNYLEGTKSLSANRPDGAREAFFKAGLYAASFPFDEWQAFAHQEAVIAMAIAAERAGDAAKAFELVHMQVPFRTGQPVHPSFGLALAAMHLRHGYFKEAQRLLRHAFQDRGDPAYFDGNGRLCGLFRVTMDGLRQNPPRRLEHKGRQFGDFHWLPSTVLDGCDAKLVRRVGTPAPQSFRLHFATNSDVPLVSQANQVRFQEMVAMIRRHSTRFTRGYWLVTGHADQQCPGHATQRNNPDHVRACREYNYGLSERRANSVQSRLSDAVGSTIVIKTTGKGMESPLKDVGWHTAHGPNRRVELTFVPNNRRQSSACPFIMRVNDSNLAGGPHDFQSRETGIFVGRGAGIAFVVKKNIAPFRYFYAWDIAENDLASFGDFTGNDDLTTLTRLPVEAGDWFYLDDGQFEEKVTIVASSHYLSEEGYRRSQRLLEPLRTKGAGSYYGRSSSPFPDDDTETDTKYHQPLIGSTDTSGEKKVASPDAKKRDDQKGGAAPTRTVVTCEFEFDALTTS